MDLTLYRRCATTVTMAATVEIVVRVNQSIVDRVDAIVKSLGADDVVRAVVLGDVTRDDVFRLALAEGCAALEARPGLAHQREPVAAGVVSSTPGDILD